MSVFALTLLISPSGAAATGQTKHYIGSGKRLQIELAVRGHEVIRARVVTRVSCKTVSAHGKTRFHLQTYRQNLAYSPLGVDGRGRFRTKAPNWAQEEEIPPTERLTGRVLPGRIVGSIALHWTLEPEPESFSDFRETCQTGPFPPSQMTETSFRARLQ